MIRIRRVRQRVPIGRLYEVELSGEHSTGGTTHSVTRGPVSLLEPIVGVGDAWSFVHEADRQWEHGNRGWAVEWPSA